MREWRRATLLCAGLLAAAAQNAANASPSPGSQDDVQQARIALGFDPAKRCPELRPADPADSAVTLVLFRVGPSGVPSEQSVKSTSGSTSLDAAALKCVSQLRFQPATSWGDGNAVASWQQMAWRWTKPQTHPDAAAAAASTAPASAAAPAGAVTAGAVTAGAAAVTAAAVTGTTAAAADAAQSGGGLAASATSNTVPAAGTEVRVCVDSAGKLAQDPVVTRSPGDSSFDQAAVRIARSGSGYYRPAMVNGKPAAACVQLAIRPEKG
jgi:TonB family protein